MNDRERIIVEIAYRRARSRFVRAWAKGEIFLGLLAVGIGILCGMYLLSRPGDNIPWLHVALDLLLMVLGGYLALAGQRSHLYQSTFEQTAFLLEEIQSLKQATTPEEERPSYEHTR